MRLIERVTKEARDDNVWKPYPLETYCWTDWDSDSEYWAFFLFAPFVWLYHYLQNTNWSKRNSDHPPVHLQQDFLNLAIRDTILENQLHDVRPYIRDLQAYEDGLKKRDASGL